MALVDYTSSDEDQDVVANSSLSAFHSQKSLQNRDIEPNLPPLPSKFHDLYASSIRPSIKDDPSLHGGRKRAYPHIPGNWPTHIYLEWCPSTSERSFLNQLILAVKANDMSFEINSFLMSELKVPLPLHVSLSRPIQITTEQKESFVASIRHSIESSVIQPFQISFSRLAWVANLDKSRWFLILRALSIHGDEMQKLLHICNNIVQKYGQHPLYEDSRVKTNISSSMIKISRVNSSSNLGDVIQNSMFSTEPELTSNSFHMSIAWSLVCPGTALMECVQSITESNVENITNLKIEVESVKMKVGNTVLSIPLHKNVTGSWTLIEK